LIPIPSERPGCRGLSGGTYPTALRDLAFQLCSVSGDDLLSPENKKPGVERRAKPPLPGGFARSSTDFYPVLVTCLTWV
jgi:hypothetical protein